MALSYFPVSFHFSLKDSLAIFEGQIYQQKTSSAFVYLRCLSFSFIVER